MKYHLLLIVPLLFSCATTQKSDKILSQDEIVVIVTDKCKDFKDDVQATLCQLAGTIEYCVNNPINRTELCKQAIKTCYMLAEDVDECLPGGVTKTSERIPKKDIKHHNIIPFKKDKNPDTI